MKIEGYTYLYHLSDEETQALLLCHRSFAIVDTDAMWRYMTTGQVLEGQANGRTADTAGRAAEGTNREP